MKQVNNTSLREKDEKGRRRWLPLLLLLLFLLLVSSTIVGFILGRSTSTAPLGQIIDTILLTPEEPAGQAVIHLSGQVAYSDGTPAAGRTLQLHSDPVTTVSASNGGFLFPNVAQGEHTISVLNEDGSVAARREIQVYRDQNAKAVSIERQESGAYVIELAVDVRVLEIKIELDAGELFIDPQRATYALQDGTVITPSGSASIQDGVVVSPGGNIYLPDGSVVFPGGSKSDPTYILQRDDTVLVDQAVSIEEIRVSADGTVTLPDQTVIEPGGQIKRPDGSSGTPGETGVIIDSETVTPIGGKETQPPADSESASSTGTAGENTNPPPASSDDASGSEGGAPTPVPTAPPDPGKLEVSTAKPDGTFVSWEQHCVIDLFYNRTTGQGEAILPGSSGYYLFRLKNGRQEDLTVTLSIAKQADSPYIPLNFTLHPQGVQAGGVSAALRAEEPLTLGASLAAGEEIVYQLDWEWPFESGDDAADTAAGSQGGKYTLHLTIHAEGGNG